MNQKLTGKELIPGYSVSSILHVNDRVELGIDGKSYPSRIEDIASEYIVIAAPINKGKIISIHSWQKVKLAIVFREAVHEFGCLVGNQSLGRVPTITLTNLEHIRDADRRSYPRTREAIKVEFRSRGIGPWEEGITDDLGGGGLRVARKDSTRLAVGDTIDLRILLPGHPTINTACRVLRVNCTPNIGGPYGYWAAEFTHIYPKDRNDLVTYVAERSEDPSN